MAFVANQLYRLADYPQQPAGDFLDFGVRRGMFKNHDKLIPAQPRHDLARTQGLAQSLRGFHQQGIAGFVAERIIDDLEAIEIDEQHRELQAAALCRHHGRVKQLVEQLAVGQPCQAVMRRQIFDPLFCLELLIRPIEIIEGKGNVVGNTL